jgi:hypothetical protein
VYFKIREIRCVSATIQTPDKILRDTMHEGPDRALLPGQAIPAVQLAFLQRRCKSDRGLTFGELEQFIEANPAKWQKTDVRY